MSNHTIQIHPSAAGIIVYKRENSKTLFLGLIALKKFQIKNKGLYDVPKGRVDPGETPIQAAYRECWEEAALQPTGVVAGPYKKDRLCLWVAEINKDPQILPNPETGELEHLGFEWVEPREMINNCLDYLRPFIIWADEEICKRH